MSTYVFLNNLFRSDWMQVNKKIGCKLNNKKSSQLRIIYSSNILKYQVKLYKQF